MTAKGILPLTAAVCTCACVVVVVIVDSPIQGVVLSTEETTVTQQVSHRAIKCQSRKEVRRSTGHIMVTTRYSDQQGSKSPQKVCDFTSNGTDQCQNGSSNLLTPYREQPRSTRIVVAYPRPAFSATKRTNYTPISFDQQVQVSRGHTSYRKKGN